jgi:hypothetical protein
LRLLNPADGTFTCGVERTRYPSLIIRKYSVPQLKMLLKEVERILERDISLDDWEKL